MRLTPKAVRAIQRGEKTQHRVLVGDPEPRQRRNGTTYLSQPFHPAVGQTIPVQPETRDEDGQLKLEQVRVLITATKKGLLGDITLDQAHAEGHKTISDFADDWMRSHTTSWPPQTEAICKQCDGWGEYLNHQDETVVCEQCDIGVVMVDDAPTSEEILSRFERKHAHHLVWVVTFEASTDITRFMNRRAHLPPTTIVSEALDPEAPILGAPRPDWKQRAEARHRATLRDRDGARLAGLSNEWDRLQELKRLADERGVDSVKVIRRANQQLEDKVRRAPDTTRRAA